MYKETINIGTLQLENRLVMPPMATEKTENGKVSEALIHYYKERSGKIGLIITEHAYVEKRGKASANMLPMDENADLDGLRRLTDAIHAAGTTKVFAQINHAGVQIHENVACESPVVVDALSLEEIEALKQAYIDAAKRAKEVGYDGVEIHCAHGYLLNQFYSPLHNHRSDAYSGSSLDGRTCLQCEIIRGVREAVGEDYPVAFRFGAWDHLEGGSKLEEAAEAAKRFEDAGVDLLDISGGCCKFSLPDNTNPGYFGEETALIKAAVSIPVMLTGGLRTNEDCETVLENGICDLVGIGRPLLMDADYVNKLLEIENE